MLNCYTLFTFALLYFNKISQVCLIWRTQMASCFSLASWAMGRPERRRSGGSFNPATIPTPLMQLSSANRVSLVAETGVHGQEGDGGQGVRVPRDGRERRRRVRPKRCVSAHQSQTAQRSLFFHCRFLEYGNVQNNNCCYYCWFLLIMTGLQSSTASTDFCLDRFFWATLVLILLFLYFFVSGPCARLSWPSRQLFSAR